MRDLYGIVYAIDERSGAIQWNYTVVSARPRFSHFDGIRMVTACGVPEGYDSPIVWAGIVYVGNSGEVYALDAYNGTLKWNYTTSGPVHSSPVIDSRNGIVYVGSDDGYLYVFNISTKPNGNDLDSFVAIAGISGCVVAVIILFTTHTFKRGPTFIRPKSKKRK